jgi:hypothetical protein
VPDGRPALNIAQRLMITWPASATNWALECCEMLPGSAWQLVTNTPVLLEGQPVVILNTTPGQMFFRMRKTP